MAQHGGDLPLNTGGGDARQQPGFKRRACAKCARLKMKCLWPPEDKVAEPDACIRRVAQLEQRIDGILSLLSTNPQPHEGAGAHSSPSPLTPESNVTVNNPDQEQTARPFFHPRPPPANVTRSNPAASNGIFELLPNFRLTVDQASTYLALYRRNLMPKFPFVIVPHDVDALALRRKSKCLFWAIMATVAPLTPEVLSDFKQWFRQHLAQEIVVKQQKKLELLQAILVQLAWGDFQFYVDMPSTAILQLANSLVVDLKLDKAPGDTFLPSQPLLADAWKALEMRIPPEPTHTSHEMRAVLGYFHVSSPSASLFRRGPRLPWTGYLDRCCEALEKAREYDTDLHVVAMARLHRTADHINTIFNSDGALESPRYLRTPAFMAIERIQAELKSIVDAYNKTEAPNHAISCHYHVLTMRLYEPLINMSPVPLSNVPSNSPEPFHRTEGLWRCVQAAADYFAAQASICNSELHNQPFTFIGLAAFAIVTVSRLLLLDNSPDWNAAAARSRLDFASVLAFMGDQIEEADRVARISGHSQRLLEDGNGSASKYCFKVRWIRQWYLAKLPEAERAAMNASMGDVSSGMAAAPGQFDEMPFFESLWDGFLVSMDPTLLSMPVTMPPDQVPQGHHV